MEEVQDFELFGKEMKLEYAKTKSDAQVKKETPDQFEGHKRARLAEKGDLTQLNFPSWKWIELTRILSERKQAQEAASLKRAPPAAVPDPGIPSRPAKTARGAGLKSTGGATAVIPDEYLPPNKILFVQSIPEGYDVDGLTAIFSRFEGFREVRLVPGRTGIAFVEYEAEQGAISAKERTAGMVLGDEVKGIKVTFQRQ
jgi:hypothetical protein